MEYFGNPTKERNLLDITINRLKIYLFEWLPISPQKESQSRKQLSTLGFYSLSVLTQRLQLSLTNDRKGWKSQCEPNERRCKRNDAKESQPYRFVNKMLLQENDIDFISENDPLSLQITFNQQYFCHTNIVFFLFS